VFGSPLTIAPEILAGAAPTPSSDLYSLGASISLLGNRPPFAAQTLPSSARCAAGHCRHLGELRPDLPAPFVLVVERALNRDPGLRYQSAAEMETALRTAMAPPPAPRHSLPAETDLLIGREEELSELEQTFGRGSRLVTLLGPAGIGKTRLAVHYGWHALDSWPGGVWFCDLSEAMQLDRIVSVSPDRSRYWARRHEHLGGRSPATTVLMLLGNFGGWSTRRGHRDRGSSGPGRMLHRDEPRAPELRGEPYAAGRCRSRRGPALRRARQHHPDCALDGAAAEDVRSS
jgi:hypothetical protein